MGEPNAERLELDVDLNPTVLVGPRRGELRRAPLAPGTSVGRYLVIEESGRGGTGAVVRAYDPKLQREVALKLLHTGAMSEEARASLMHEARAMAQLSHPNVVAVYDVEIDDVVGVMLVMEYVPGTTLRTWLARGARPWSEIVDAFVHAGHGLAAAHAVGLLHRDFKPANVLVGTDGRVRVTDFGLARVHRGDDSPLHVHSSDEGYARREFGGAASGPESSDAIRGTPIYMAPEQHDGADVGVAADQYALCVSLWEALSGSLPFVGRIAALRVAKREGPGAWPGQTEPPRRVVNAIRRGLAPNPRDRWPSVLALLECLQQAQRAGSWRRRFAVGGGATLLCAAAAWQFWPAIDRPCTGALDRLGEVWTPEHAANTEAKLAASGLVYARTTAQRVNARLEEYGAAWAAMHTDACEATAVRREQSTEALDLRMACLEVARRQLGAVVEVLEGADDQVVENADRLVESLDPLDRCADVEALAAAVTPPRPEQAEAVDSAREHLTRARAVLAAGKHDLAAEILDRVAGRIEAIDYAPLHVELWSARGGVRNAQARYEDAAEDLRRVVEAAPRLRQWEEATSACIMLVTVVGVSLAQPEVGLAYAEFARSLADLGKDAEGHRLELRAAVASVWSAQGKYAEAEAEHLAVVAALEQRYGPDHPDVVRGRSRVVSALHAQGKYIEAEHQVREALVAQIRVFGPEHPLVATTRSNLAVVLAAQGRYAEAEAEHLEILELRTRVLGPDHLQISDSRDNLAQVLAAQGKHEAAEFQLRLALAARIDALGEDHPQVASVRNNITGPLVALGKVDEAEVMLRAALAGWERALGPEHPDVSMARGNLAVLMMDRGDAKGAETLLRDAMPAWERALGEDHPDVLRGHATLGLVLERLGRFDEAEAELRTTLARLDRRDEPDDPFRATTHADLANVLEQAKRLPDAEVQWRAALAIMARRYPSDDPELARIRMRLGQCILARRGDRKQALALIAAAETTLDAARSEATPRAPDPR